MNKIDIAQKLRIVKQFGGWEELKHGLLFFFKYVINISKINLNILLIVTKTNLRQKTIEKFSQNFLCFN